MRDWIDRAIDTCDRWVSHPCVIWTESILIGLWLLAELILLIDGCARPEDAGAVPTEQETPFWDREENR